jgi:hypothetical protein
LVDATPAQKSSTSAEAGAEEAIYPVWPVDEGRFSAVFPEAPYIKRDADKTPKGSIGTTFASGGAMVLIICSPPAAAAGWRTTAAAAGWRQFDFYGTTAMSDAEHDKGKSYLREQLEFRGRYCVLQASFRDAVPAESALAQACLRSFRPRDVAGD